MRRARPGLLLPKHLALIIQRRRAGPAFECPVEGAELRVPQQESDFGKRVFAVLEVAHCKTLAGIFNQLLEVKAIFLESPLEGTRTHRHLFRDPCKLRITIAHRFCDHLANRAEKAVFPRHLAQYLIKVLLHDLVQLLICSRDLSLNETKLDNQGIRLTAKHYGGTEDSMVL